MRFTIVVLALLACALVSAERRGPAWHQLSLSYTFDRYTKDFSRTYDKSSSEYNFREKMFNINLRDILRHNADPSHTFKRGVNQFTDWSEQEWKDYNNAKLKYRPSALYDGTVPTFKSNGVILPFNIDYRLNVNPPVLTGVKNQGHCGSCWAHSATESIESYFALATGELPVLSQGQINDCTDACDGCGGGDFFAAWQYSQNSTGLNEEWLYPYMDFWAQNMSKQATLTCQNITKKFFPNWGWLPKANVTGMTQVAENDAKATMEALHVHGPLSILVAAGAWSSYESGIFYGIPITNTSWEIDHAVQLVGYGHDEDLNQNYWIVRNSWGTTWGEDGYIRLARPDVEPCGYDQGQKVCGVSGLLCSPGFPQVTKLSRLNP